MKLLFIGNVGYRFNAFAYSSAMAAKEIGVEFHIAGSWTGYDNPNDLKKDEEKYGIKIHQIDFIRTPYDPRNIIAYKQIKKLIRQEGFDIIHCNTPIGGVVGRLAGVKCGVRPVIYQAHGFHFYDGAPKINWLLYYPIEKWLAHKTDVLITINQEDYKRAQGFKLRRNGKVYYVPGVGIDIDQYEDIYSSGKREELGIPTDAVVLISVGDLNKNKNNEVIIRALIALQDPNIHYIVCGEGELKNHLIQLASPIIERVHFLGYRTDVKELMGCSDIFVMPSLREGLSRSLMEAMACGLACIASKIRGNTDLIDESGGRLVDPRSTEKWVLAIKEMADNEGIRSTCGKNNKDKISLFSLKRVIQEIRTIYATSLNIES